jgi:hypothetical protein
LTTFTGAGQWHNCDERSESAKLKLRRRHEQRAGWSGTSPVWPAFHSSIWRTVSPKAARSQSGSTRPKKIASNRWRKLTTKLPLGVVYARCLANEALFAWARSLPRGGGRLSAVIPGGSLGTPFLAPRDERFRRSDPALRPRSHRCRSAEVVYRGGARRGRNPGAADRRSGPQARLR